MAKTKRKKKITKTRTHIRRTTIILTAINAVLAMVVIAVIAHSRLQVVATVAAHHRVPVLISPSPTPSPMPSPTPAPVAAPPVAKAARTVAPVVPKPKPVVDQGPRYIAHAGGQYQGKTYTNTIAALEHSYQVGYRLLEVDLNLTSDGQVVLLHDWGSTVQNVFGIAPGQRDLPTFLADTARSPLQVAQLADLANWLRAHPAARIILDSKTDAIAMMTTVAARYPDLRPRFIAYIYNFDQFQAIANLGFANISLLTGPGQYTPVELLSFARGHRLQSIAMTPAALSAQLPELFHATIVYCWTINSPSERTRLFALGAYGVITDWLGPV